MESAELFVAFGAIALGTILGVVYAYSKFQTEKVEERWNKEQPESDDFIDLSQMKGSSSRYKEYSKLRAENLSEVMLKWREPKDSKEVQSATKTHRIKANEELKKHIAGPSRPHPRTYAHPTFKDRLENVKKEEGGFSSIDHLGIKREANKEDFLILRPDKKVRVRILPPHKESSSIYSVRHLHYCEGCKPVTCTEGDAKFSPPCPICEWRSALQECNRYSEAQRVGSMPRFYYNVLNRDEEFPLPKILSVGATIHKMILAGLPRDAATTKGRMILQDFMIAKRSHSEYLGALMFEGSGFCAMDSAMCSPGREKQVLDSLHDLDMLLPMNPKPEVAEEMLAILKDKFTPEPKDYL